MKWTALLLNTVPAVLVLLAGWLGLCVIYWPAGVITAPVVLLAALGLIGDWMEASNPVARRTDAEQWPR
jgi:hypothetical protein